MAEISGDRQLRRQLRRLAERDAQRIQRAAINKALTVIARGIRRLAPVGKTRNLKKSIGKRFKRRKRTGEIEAKAGIGVGKKKPKLSAVRGATDSHGSRSMAPHAHLVALGTKPRYTKRGAYRGVMPSNDFVDRGYEQTRAAAIAAEREAIVAGIQKAIRSGA